MGYELVCIIFQTRIFHEYKLVLFQLIILINHPIESTNRINRYVSNLTFHCIDKTCFEINLNLDMRLS